MDRSNPVIDEIERKREEELAFLERTASAVAQLMGRVADLIADKKG